MHLLLGFLFCLLPFSSFSDDSQILSLANQKKWHRLLHYKKKFSGIYISEADAKGFFLSPRGRTQPIEEFEATLRAFKEAYQTEKADKHALCRFPARRRWFVAKGLIELPKNLVCPMFDRFRAVVDADKVSMVFSSYYLNNPSSAFGHTFLRFHRKDSKKFGEKAELLDSGVNYAAETTTTNAFLYGVYGLTGVFKGFFAKLPYYYKVREYADYESRDLWDLELNLTQAQVDELVEHLWELGQTYFDYYFLTENCSYQLLALLEILNDDWNFTQELPYFFVIPAETLKVLNSVPGLIVQIQFRPSSRRVFENSFKSLNKPEISIFENVIKHKDPLLIPASISLESKQKILDTAIDYWDFKESSAILKEETWAMELKQKFLLSRSQVPLVTPLKKHSVPENENPLLSHNPSIVGLMVGRGTYDKTFFDFNFRSAFHNKIDSWIGSPTHTSMEVISLQGRYSLNSKRVDLMNFSLVNIESLSPVRTYQMPLSWDLKVGAERISEKNHCLKDRCVAAVARVGGGTTFETFSNISVSFIGDYELAISHRFIRGSIRQSLGPRLIIYRPLFERIGFSYDLKAYYHLFYKNNWSLKHGFMANYKISKDLDTQIQASFNEMSKELSIGLRYFF